MEDRASDKTRGSAICQAPSSFIPQVSQGAIHSVLRSEHRAQPVLQQFERGRVDNERRLTDDILIVPHRLHNRCDEQRAGCGLRENRQPFLPRHSHHVRTLLQAVTPHDRNDHLVPLQARVTVLRQNDRVPGVECSRKPGIEQHDPPSPRSCGRGRVQARSRPDPQRISKRLAQIAENARKISGVGGEQRVLGRREDSRIEIGPGLQAVRVHPVGTRLNLDAGCGERTLGFARAPVHEGTTASGIAGRGEHIGPRLVAIEPGGSRRQHEEMTRSEPTEPGNRATVEVGG